MMRITSGHSSSKTARKSSLIAYWTNVIAALSHSFRHDWHFHSLTSNNPSILHQDAPLPNPKVFAIVVRSRTSLHSLLKHLVGQSQTRIALHVGPPQSQTQHLFPTIAAIISTLWSITTTPIPPLDQWRCHVEGRVVTRPPWPGKKIIYTLYT